MTKSLIEKFIKIIESNFIKSDDCNFNSSLDFFWFENSLISFSFERDFLFRLARVIESNHIETISS